MRVIKGLWWLGKDSLKNQFHAIWVQIHDDTFPLVCLANYVTRFYVVSKPQPSHQTGCNGLTIHGIFWCLICESKNRLHSCHFLLARAVILIHYLFTRCITLSPLLNYFAFWHVTPNGNLSMHAFNFEMESKLHHSKIH